VTDFIQVSREQFYEVINPLERFSFRPEREQTWAILDDRHVIGKCVPGYVNRDKDGNYTDKKQWFLTPECAARIERGR
jgi:hypothetical protein